jgi:hypothetical protein
MKALYIFVAFILTGCSEWNTRYGHPDLKAKFKLIQTGDSVETVYATIGPPLFIDVNPDRAGSGAYQQESLGTVDLSVVMRVSADTNKELYLTYSHPKKGKGGKNYILYAIDIRGGKVFRKVGPSYQD